MYRVLEKMAGAASKVIDIVAGENGFQAWQQLNWRFEPELEACPNTMVLKLHNIPAANTVEESTVKMVELKVRIARADNILGMQIRNMHKVTALRQVTDPIIKRHAETMNSHDFNDFYMRAMSFANNASIRHRSRTKTNANVSNENERFYLEKQRTP